ncbi:MAG: phosphopantetheine-binding protein [Pseudomonadota bacterium]
MDDVVKESVQDRIVSILAEQAMMDPSEVTLDATLEELGIDSLGVVETVFAIEEGFDVQVPFNANEPESGEFDISSVATIVAAVEKLIAAKN